LATYRARWFPPQVFGTWVNAGAIITGAVIGLSSGRSLVRQQLLMVLLSALALYTGFSMVWQGIDGHPMRVLLQLGLALFALVLGNIVGKALGLQRQSNRLGRHAREQYEGADARRRADFSGGFVAGAILFCAAPLAIPGALQEGLQGDPRPLLLKAGIEGLASIGLARTLGPGVIAAVLPMIAWQGTLTLGMRALLPHLRQPGIMDGFSVVCGLMVAMTSLTLLNVRKVPMADYLPALVIGPVLRVWIA
jgi:uncharacterized membrane protein YqgA involved in biofilm formation